MVQRVQVCSCYSTAGLGGGYAVPSNYLCKESRFRKVIDEFLHLYFEEMDSCFVLLFFQSVLEKKCMLLVISKEKSGNATCIQSVN